MKLLHTVLSHWEPEVVDLLLEYHLRLDPSVDLLLAYGGPESNFSRITWKQKVFIADPRLRGSTDQQNYCHWLRATTAWAKTHPVLPDAVFFTETDHPMLRKGYGQELTRILQASSCGFLGKWCSNREGSNSYFYLKYREDPDLRRVLRGASGVDDSPIYEALATGMLFRWYVLEQVQAEAIDIPVFTEVIIPSMIRALGYRLGCFDRHSNFMNSVRYRPNMALDEAAAIRNSGGWCCHPVKEVANIGVLLRQDGESARL
jgi:hypothetical protein